MTPIEYAHSKFMHVYNVLSSPGFRKMDALGGEIPFWIAAYEMDAHNQVETEITNLTKKLLNGGITTLTIDLFELSCQLVDEHIGLDKMFEVELKKNKEKFLRALQSTINIHERLVPAIVEQIQKVNPQILLIKGVASVYPFIRSHNVLNNLQSAVKEIPTVMFFPGIYSGRSLNLFGVMQDDNYYRAFNIDNYKL